MLKKIFIILCVLILLIGAGLMFFIATFDANRFRPLMEEKASEAIGSDVKIGDIELKWQNGIAFSMQDLGIYKKQASTPSFEILEANATLKLIPLLNRSIEMGVITLVKPDISLRRNSIGEIEIDGIDLKKIAAQQQPQKEAVALPFLIKTIRIENGNVAFRDETLKPAANLSIKQLTIELKNVSLIRPTDIVAEAAVFADSPNINIKGRFYPPRPGKAGALKKTNLSLDLSTIQIGELVRSYPPARAWGIKNKLGGKFKLNADEIALDPGGIEKLKGSLELSNGYVEHVEVADPIENITLDARLDAGTLNLETFQADWAGSQLRFAGKVFTLFATPKSTLNGSIRDFDIAKLATNIPAGQPYLTGILQASVDGQVIGANMNQISTTLNGAGEIQVKDPVLVNVNILREVFNQLSMLPGLVDRLRARLPEEYLAKLDANETVFEDMQIPFQATGGVLNVPNLRLATDMFELTGTAVSTLYGVVDTQFMLTLDATLTEALTRSVAELRYLSDADGRLQLPLSYRGPVQSFRPLPNLQYVASKLVASKAQDFIGELLGGRQQQQTEEQQTTENAEGQTETSENEQAAASEETQEQNNAAPQNPEDALTNLLGGLLQDALS